MDEHLHSDEHEQHADTHFQIAELVRDGRQQEEEGPQAEYREDVGEEHHIRVKGDREHGRNAVEREYQVAELDEYHRYHQRLQVEILVEELHHRVVQGVHLLLLVAIDEHLDSAVQQERAEYQEYPVEAADEGGACEDEDEAQDDGSQNTPVEGVLVVFLVNAERCEYHHHHEEIVHRQRLFYQITRNI